MIADNSSENFYRMELEKAIISVLSGINVSAANDYILKVVDTNEAWNASMMICTANDNDHIRYFAANILYTKVRRHWSQLPEEKRDFLTTFLSNIIHGVGNETITSPTSTITHSFKLYLDRIILTLCCASSRAPCGIKQFLLFAHSLIDPSCPINKRSQVGLDMLAVAPAEVEALDVSRVLRVELQDQLLGGLPQVLILIDTISKHEKSKQLTIAVTRLLTNWLTQGITLSSVFEDQRSAVDILWIGLQSGDSEAVIQCCSFLRDIVLLDEFPRPESRDRAIKEVMHMITQSAPTLAPFFTSQEDNNSTVHGICTAIVSLIIRETMLVSSIQGCNPSFFQLLLQCTSMKPRSIAALTFDAWLSLQDIPLISRHPYLHQEIFYSLFDSLLLQCSYPANFTTWDDNRNDDEDDFLAFRDSKQGIQDVLIICFYSLQEIFFQYLYDKIKISVTWYDLEVVLFILYRYTLFFWYSHRNINVNRHSKSRNK